MRKSQQKALEYHYWHQQTFQQKEAEYKKWQSEQQMIRRMELARDAQQIEETTLTNEQVSQVYNVVQEQFQAYGVNLVSVGITIGVIAHAATVGYQGLFEAIGNVVELRRLKRK